MDDPSLEPVLRLVRERAPSLSPEAFSRFERLLEIGGESAAERLLEEVDQSDYSLADWVEALAAFDTWLESRGVDERPVPEMLGYIHCCTLTNAPTIDLPSLNIIVDQSLTEFGFEVISESHL